MTRHGPLRIYWSSRDYPELREVRSLWRRQIIWFKAFCSGARDRRLWRIFVLNAGILLTGLGLAGVTLSLAIEWAIDGTPQGLAALIVLEVLLVALVVAALCVISLTYGAKLMRPHLRRVDAHCREACPYCGYGLRAQIQEADWPLRCPECGGRSDRAWFEEPFHDPAADPNPPPAD